MKTQKIIALYARVSTADKGQNPEVQLEPMRLQARAFGLPLVEYVDHTSGAKDSRPALNRMMQDVKAGKVGVVMVWKFDRFARSSMHLHTALATFKSSGVEFVSYSEKLDTTTPSGKLMFSMLAAFAEFERNIIAERVKAGLSHARSRGVRLGRKALELNVELDPAKSLRQISRETGISLTTLRRRNQAAA